MISTLEAVDVNGSQLKADPFPFYARLRAEAPVFPTTGYSGQRTWLITRYHDCVNALRDQETFVNDPGNATPPGQKRKKVGLPVPILRPLARTMLVLDAPDHPRIRGLVHKAFTPAVVEQMRRRAETVCDELLDRVQAQGRMDLVADYALPLPMTIITDILGVPLADQDKFKHWSSQVVSSTSAADFFKRLPSMIGFLRYVRRLINLRRAEPGDDLVSRLVQAEDGGVRLSEDELISLIFLLLIAGHETTVNLVANGTLALLNAPDQLALLRENPSLGRSAVEELLRFGAPVERTSLRYAARDVTIEGVTIRHGDAVQAVLASANRDDAVFINPNELDITRDPNRHIAFGFGAHYCVGGPLARLEGEIAFNTLVQRLPNLRLAVPEDQLRWNKSNFVRGVTALPVTF